MLWLAHCANAFLETYGITTVPLLWQNQESQGDEGKPPCIALWLSCERHGHDFGSWFFISAHY